MSRLKVLVTGVAGRIGPHILGPFNDRYDVVLLDRKDPPGYSGTVISDLQDRDVLRRAMEGVDVVVHLAATSDEAPFIENLVPNNVVGVYNVFQAALEAKVRRVVFASTGQTMNSRVQPLPMHPTDPPSPVTIYGVTKVFGEILGRYYRDQHGLEFIGIRIGAFQDYESEWMLSDRPPLNAWLSPKDLVQILTLAIEKPDIAYAVVNATSKPVREQLSLDEARDILGYEPIDDAARYVKTN